MTAAYVLAGKLAKADGQHNEAFQNYEQLLRPFISAKQQAARRFAGSFAPKTRFGLTFRNQVIRAMCIPGLAKYSIGRGIVDTLELPEYFMAGARLET